MKRYVKFEPSKVPIYEDHKNNKLYLFKKDKLMVKKEDVAYNLPTKRDLKGKNIELKYFQCLGALNEINCYCAEVDEILDDDIYEFIGLREYFKRVDYNNFLVSGKALLLLDFVRNNKRCGLCGSPMEIRPGGGDDRAIVCTACSNIIWPKIAPAIIVAVTKEDKLLLAHNSMFPDGVYSVVAGFVEMGETFEQAVKREVYEETSIKVKNIEYFGSQPWPFPNSMMIGFTAEYLEGEIEVDNYEILDAKWFSKKEIPGIYNKSISISSQLIEWFLNKEIKSHK